MQTNLFIGYGRVNLVLCCSPRMASMKLYSKFGANRSIIIGRDTLHLLVYFEGGVPCDAIAMGQRMIEWQSDLVVAADKCTMSLRRTIVVQRTQTVSLWCRTQ